MDVYFETAPNYRIEEIPRVGMQWVLNSTLENARYYGRGPHENYIDRKSSAFIGIYESPIKELHYSYIRPQENGYHTDIRWLELTNKEGKGLKIVGNTPFCFNAQNYATEDYVNEPRKIIQKTYELKPRKELYLNIDYGQRGVGGDNSWGFKPHIENQLLWREYKYSYTIAPL